MPNGSDKNYVRLCGAVDGFRVRYGRWPTTTRLWPGCIDSLRHCLSEKGFARLSERLRLVEEEGATVMVEDEEGRSYDYGTLGFPSVAPDIVASDWIGAERRQPTPEELEAVRRMTEELRREYPDADHVIVLPD
jgi:hypothetical protein